MWEELNSTPLVIDGQDVADRIKAGRYDWVHPDIDNQNFTPSLLGADVYTFYLFHPRQADKLANEAAVAEPCGLKPATIEVVLAVGVHFPDKQKSFPIIGSGATCWLRRPYVSREGEYRVCLDQAGQLRTLSLVPADSPFYPPTRWLYYRRGRR